MNITKAISTVGVGAAIVAGSMLAVNYASAQTNSDRQSEVVDRLSTELNVDKDAVQSVFDEIKAEHKAERQAAQDERIAGLVTDGSLTQEQADALKAKQEEMQSAREALRDQDLPREEMKAQMEASRDEFKAWAEEQGIDLEVIRPEANEKGGRGDRGQHRFSEGNEAQES